MSRLSKAVPKEKREEIKNSLISRLLDYLFGRLKKRVEKPATDPEPQDPSVN